MKTLICSVCGLSFEVSDYTRFAKYCPECRRKVKNAWNKTGPLEKAPEGWKELQTLDTPENIKKCLSCRLTQCRSGTGMCPICRDKHLEEVRGTV